MDGGSANNARSIYLLRSARRKNLRIMLKLNTFSLRMFSLSLIVSFFFLNLRALRG